MTLRIAILAGAVVLCSACSIFFDTSEYWRATDGGVPDDAAPQSDGASPAADGGRDGGANRPPRLTAARVDRYLVFEDETLRAVPIGLSDPDGDEVRIEYRWLADDAPVPGELDAALDVTAAGLTAGAPVSVQLTPVDDHDLAGDPITVGPIVVLPDETRWRPLAPSRNAPHPLVGFDRTGRRLLLVEATDPSASRTWELPLDDPEALWVALDASGDHPPALEGAVATSSDTRLFVLGGVRADSTPNDSLYELALDPRGAERWTARTPSGDGPADLTGVAMVHDAARDRLLVFGGGAAADTLFALDLSSDPPAWSEITSSGSTWPAGRRDAALALGPEGDAAYLVGGRDSAGPVEDLWRLDLTTDTFDHDGALPGAFVGQAAVVSPSGDALLLLDVDVGGVSSPHRVALSDLAVTALEPSETSPADARTFGFRDQTEGRVLLYVAGGGLGGSVWWVAEDGSGAPRHRSGVDAPPPLQRAASAVRDADGAWYVLAGRTAAGDTNAVWRYELGVDRWAPMAVSGAPEPEGAPAAVRTDAGVALYTHGNVYELVSNGPGLEAARGTINPIPHFEGGTAIEGCPDTWLAIFGGRLGDTWSDSTQLFECDASECNWRTDSATAPPARGYASADRVSVAGEATPSILLWGGFTDSSPLPNEVWTTPPACGSAGVSWQSRSTAGTSRPNGRGGHTLIATDGPAMILFGGASSVGAPRDGMYDALWVLDTSGASVRWTRLRLDGPAPSGRSFHVAAWDSAAKRLLVYGGRGPLASQEPLGDLWELRWRPE